MWPHITHGVHAGEDVDFCIRLRDDMHAPFISVPAARVQHPFWPKPLRQIAGWAAGDVRCLDTIPTCVFRAPPNWAELAMALFFFAWLPKLLPVLLGSPSFPDASTVKPWWAAVAIVVEVAMLCVVNLQRVVSFTRTQSNHEDIERPRGVGFKEILVILVAVVPPMLQVRITTQQLCLVCNWHACVSRGHL